MLAQGSVWQALLAQPPDPQVIVSFVYTQRPPLQTPGLSYVCRWEASRQAGACGDVQTIGVPVQPPAVQVSLTVQSFPSSQSAPSTKAYWHAPRTQVPVSA